LQRTIGEVNPARLRTLLSRVLWFGWAGLNLTTHTAHHDNWIPEFFEMLRVASRVVTNTYILTILQKLLMLRVASRVVTNTYILTIFQKLLMLRVASRVVTNTYLLTMRQKLLMVMEALLLA
jgi:adenylyl- and sulfurtransferase ThiI